MGKQTEELMDFLKVSSINKKIGTEVVLDDISFQQQPFEKIVIAGETGSGKSTLLKVIAGLEQQDSGEVIFEGQKVRGAADSLVPGHKSIAYLSQHFELPQFLRVEQVLEYANTINPAYAKELFRICAIDHLAHRRTDELSGGERQRIALAKLLIASPTLLLLDEPFTNLDMVQKNILKTVISDMAELLKISIILVSHDPLDILPWADRIIVMKDGKFIQGGAPAEIYEKPVDEYAAGLFGRYNVIQSALLKNIFPDQKLKNKRALTRPEFIKILRPREDGLNGKVSAVQFYGSYCEVQVKILRQTVYVRMNSNIKLPAKGSEVSLNFDRKKIVLV